MPKAQDTEQSHNPSVTSTKSSRSFSWLSLPEPIRRVFNKFPLLIYSANQLPQRTLIERHVPKLYIFTDTSGGSQPVLSSNPRCLKWQTLLILRGIKFEAVSSNNHASPSGTLPFLIPASTTIESQPQPIATNKLSRWLSSQGIHDDPLEEELEIYMDLIDQNIRHAWLFNLYLNEANFDSVAKPVYIKSTSTNSFVQATLAYQLRTAAQDQILLNKTVLNKEEIFEAADLAFKSLNALLGNNQFFNSKTGPGLFDVSLFAYTHPILDLNVSTTDRITAWQDSSLFDVLQQYQGLIDHRNRILRLCSNE